MAPNLGQLGGSHTTLLVLQNNPIEEQNVSIGFLTALNYALSSDKVTYLCEKQRIEKDLEAMLSVLSNPRCVEALRNIVFVYLSNVDDWLQVCIQAPMVCLSDSVVIVPDLSPYLCLETSQSFESYRKVFQGLALFNMFTKKQGVVTEKEKFSLPAGKGQPALFLCFISEPMTFIMWKRVFDQVISLTVDQRKQLWQQVEAYSLQE